MMSCWIWLSLRCVSLLSEYEYPGDDVPVVRGSALKALEGDAAAVASVVELMEQVDSFIPEPERDTEKPFLDAG